jgi:hypothetical protein
MTETVNIPFLIDTAKIAQLIAIGVGSLTIGGIIIKAFWTYIELRFKSGTIKQMEDFCREHQELCPKINDMTLFSSNQTTISNTLKEVVNEQKKLRQETLPDKYVSRSDFNGTIGRIEKNIADAVAQFNTTTTSIFARINEVSDKIR